jgi:hypothetical protein
MTEEPSLGEAPEISVHNRVDGPGSFFLFFFFLSAYSE